MFASEAADAYVTSRWNAISFYALIVEAFKVQRKKNEIMILIFHHDLEIMSTSSRSKDVALCQRVFLKRLLVYVNPRSQTGSFHFYY